MAKLRKRRRNKRRGLVPGSTTVLSPEEQISQQPIRRVRAQPVKRARAPRPGRTATPAEVSSLFGTTPPPVTDPLRIRDPGTITQPPVAPQTGTFGQPLGLAGIPPRNISEAQRRIAAGLPLEPTGIPGFEESQFARQEARRLAALRGEGVEFEDPLSPTGKGFVGFGASSPFRPRQPRQPRQPRLSNRQIKQQRIRQQQQAAFVASAQGKQFAKLMIEDIQRNPENSRENFRQLQEAGFDLNTPEGRFAQFKAQTQPPSPLEEAVERHRRIANITAEINQDRAARRTGSVQRKAKAAIEHISNQMDTLWPNIFGEGQKRPTGQESSSAQFVNETIDKVNRGQIPPDVGWDMIKDIVKARSQGRLTDVESEAIKEQRLEQQAEARQTEVFRKEERTEQAKIDEQTFQEEVKTFEDELETIKEDEVAAKQDLTDAQRVIKDLGDDVTDADKQAVEDAKAEIKRLRQLKQEKRKTRPRRRRQPVTPPPGEQPLPPPTGRVGQAPQVDGQPIDQQTGEVEQPTPTPEVRPEQEPIVAEFQAIMEEELSPDEALREMKKRHSFLTKKNPTQEEQKKIMALFQHHRTLSQPAGQ